MSKHTRLSITFTDRGLIDVYRSQAITARLENQLQRYGHEDHDIDYYRSSENHEDSSNISGRWLIEDAWERRDYLQTVSDKPSRQAINFNRGNECG